LHPLDITVCNIQLDRDITFWNIPKVEVVFTGAATRQWLSLSADVRRRLDAKLKAFAEFGRGRAKRLKGRAGSRLRVGDWRIIFYIERETIVVAAVGHRREIYD
jgi:mRNA interferase RelE/StbE